MYCLGLFVVVYSKQYCLQTNKYDQSLRVMDIHIVTKFTVCYFVIELREFNLKNKEKKNSLS